MSLALALIVVTCAGAIPGTIARARPPERSRAVVAGGARRAVESARRCPRGHVLLGLRGPRGVEAQKPETYVVLARACGGPRAPSLEHIRVSVRGPRRITWIVQRVLSSKVAHRSIKLTFPPLRNASAPRVVFLTLEARSRHGKLLGRLRVKLTYLQGAPPPLPPGGITVGWGDNFRGEAGAGFRGGPLTHPVQGLLSGVRQIAVGHNSAFALLTDGTVRAWGENGAGQLGDGTRQERLNPVRVVGLSHVAQIAESGNHALALLENGTVFAWGGDYWGNLGNGTRDTVEGIAHPVPQQVPGLSSVAAVSAGGGDDLAILSNGTVVGWGEDKNGQLGDGSTQTKLVPTPVAGLAGVRSVAIGGIPSLGGHMLALLSDGHVMVAGQNGHGQLGLGDTVDRHTPVALPGLENVVSVSASVTHSLALLSDGAVLSWGDGGDGELGYPALQVCGIARCATSPHPAPVANASAVSAGERFSVAVSGGRVLAWGNNEFGQLGDGATTQSTAPTEVAGIIGIATIAASERFTLALAAQGPAPDFLLRSGPGLLIAEWASAPGPERWAVSWRLASHPPVAWGKPVALPATTHSYVIAGLAKALYEVRLTRLDSSTFGRRIASGTPE